MQPKKKKVEKSVPTVSKKRLTRDLELSEEQLKRIRGGMIDPDPNGDPGGSTSDPILM